MVFVFCSAASTPHPPGPHLCCHRLAETQAGGGLWDRVKIKICYGENEGRKSLRQVLTGKAYLNGLPLVNRQSPAFVSWHGLGHVYPLFTDIVCTSSSTLLFTTCLVLVGHYKRRFHPHFIDAEVKEIEDFLPFTFSDLLPSEYLLKCVYFSSPVLFHVNLHAAVLTPYLMCITLHICTEIVKGIFISRKHLYGPLFIIG